MIINIVVIVISVVVIKLKKCKKYTVAFQKITFSKTCLF